jgi:2-C-methyl-D-erythritol 4-phosphate cytidylyltransferase
MHNEMLLQSRQLKGSLTAPASDLCALENAGAEVQVLLGFPRHHKVTTPLDLEHTLTCSFPCVVTKEGIDEDW